ncbi:MAG: hypothetical protein FIA89_07200 [Geobacter sp.]|jgi:hypothetical protein|nr:hypothetical protein [Geobacter sp.]
MRRTLLRIPVSILLAVLALASILLAPVAALSQHAGPEAELSVSSIGGCAGGCHDEQQDGQQGSCSDKTACCCACHAPLSNAGIDLPLPFASTSSFISFDLQDPPPVYLPIFVPPQNRA